MMSCPCSIIFPPKAIQIQIPTVSFICFILSAAEASALMTWSTWVDGKPSRMGVQKKSPLENGDEILVNIKAAGSCGSVSFPAKIW